MDGAYISGQSGEQHVIASLVNSGKSRPSVDQWGFYLEEQSV